jgi:solute carrier family 25 2-oxodicarboxylate transporter 21
MLNTPFDVIKTRVQGQLPGQPAKYGWAWPALGTIIKEEGFSALYKGFTPKVLRLGPGGGILLVVFDQVSSFIRKHLL